MSSLLFLALMGFGTAFGGENWALLVAGSNGYVNYRHQADICHAYHIVRGHGIPEERIVVMMYDDIANNSRNPIKGNIINHPNGPNLYPGVIKDYTGEEITPEVFLKVLTGDAAGVKQLLGREGKVIQSGPDDRVFVNFADHGDIGAFMFPNDELHAEDLHAAIKSMYINKQYKQMVFYIEACYSGSMFENILESNINVFVSTAANAQESSYVCYYDETRGAYLGDVYSVMWMEDSDVENLNKETLDDQYQLVKMKTNTSHVSKFGQMNLGSLKLADFQGNGTSYKNVLRFAPERTVDPTADAVSAEDVPLEILKRKISKSNGFEQMKYKAELDSLLKERADVDEFFQNVVSYVTDVQPYEYFATAPLHLTSFKCYRESITLVRELCPGMHSMKVHDYYVIGKRRVLANLCEGEIEQKIWSSIAKVSSESRLCTINTERTMF